MGYNRRAVHLHAAAGAVVERHGGVVPTDVAALERLPGVGPYTARAVASFAGERPVAVVDTNIGRVIARSDFGVARAAGAGSKALWLAADAAIPAEGGRARHRNLALMDLGALVCQARAPACDRCPLLGGCAWTASGKPRPKAQARRSQPFESTGRYARGRIVELLRIRGAATAEEIAAALPEGHRGAVGAYLAALERDSLVTCEQGTVRLGGATGG
jgi:A/G-specific adenine glycosylase